MKSPAKTKVVVVVVGGNVQDCFADRQGVEVELIDFDNASAEGTSSVLRAESRVAEVVRTMRHIY